MSGHNLPNRYRRVKKFYAPAFLRDFDHFFYANTEHLLTDTDFADWQMDLYNDQGLVAANVATLIQDVISGPGFRFYTTFKLGAGTNPGIYYFVIFNNVTDEIKFLSNCFRVITNDDLEDYLYLQFRNSCNMFNFNYELLPESNSVFLDANQVEAQPEVTIESYKSQSTGMRRNLKTQTERVVTLETFFFDDDANRTMLILGVHDDIALNGSSFTVKSGHVVDSNKFNPLQKGTMEFYDDEISTVNL